MHLDAAILDEKWTKSVPVAEPAVEAYKRATGDANAGVPACYAFVLGFDTMRRCMVEIAARTPIIHRSQRIVLREALRVGERIEAKLRIRGWTPAARGTLIELETTLRAEGELRGALSTVLYLVGTEPDQSVGTVETLPRIATTGDAAASASAAVDAATAAGYADASGDNNPIHLDEAAAKAAGLPSVVLHGMCTLAMGVAAGVNRVYDADHAQVHEVAVTFGKPVVPGSTIEYAFIAHDDGYAFSAQTADGPVLRHGFLGP